MMAAPTNSAIGYESAKRFVEVFFQQFLNTTGIAKGDTPLALIQMLERSGVAAARKALELAVNECVEMSLNWPPERVSAADLELRTHGAPTLTEVRLFHSRRYQAILRRGKVTSDQDYYLLKGIRDGAANRIDEPTSARIDRILSAFEERRH